MSASHKTKSHKSKYDQSHKSGSKIGSGTMPEGKLGDQSAIMVPEESFNEKK